MKGFAANVTRVWPDVVVDQEVSRKSGRALERLVLIEGIINEWLGPGNGLMCFEVS